MGDLYTSAKIECLLFDMDDTLYPYSLGLNIACRKNIEDYMLRHLEIDADEIPRMCLDLYKEFGTTMAGLKAIGFRFDNDEFHAHVHGRLPYEKLMPDPVLRNLLHSMPQRKIIFTNADKAHASQVLTRMGLVDCFDGVICFETLNPPQASPEDEQRKSMDNPLSDESEVNLFANVFVSKSDDKSEISFKGPILCKPSIEAMEAAIKIAKVDPSKTIFFDDSSRNIAAGKEVGLKTVIVGSSVLVPGADFALASIHNIKEALPELCEGADKSDIVHPSTAVETIVLA